MPAWRCPAGIVALSPWADLSLSGWSMLQQPQNRHRAATGKSCSCAPGIICASPIPADAYASPVFANLKDFPPVMVHAGAPEILRDDASKLGDRAADAQTCR